MVVVVVVYSFETEYAIENTLHMKGKDFQMLVSISRLSTLGHL